jgi:hypothetical protein
MEVETAPGTMHPTVVDAEWASLGVCSAEKRLMDIIVHAIHTLEVREDDRDAWLLGIREACKIFPDDPELSRVKRHMRDLFTAVCTSSLDQ